MAEDQALMEFEDTMGNQLIILNLTYRKCVDTGVFPKEKLDIMRNSAGKIFLALCKYQGVDKK